MFAHIDADAFFAAVLVRKHPHLRGKPLLALGMGGGCVISASYEAKEKGVKTGMRLADALKLIPYALRMPSDFHETALASEQIEQILREECPLLEQMSVDEWFLDLVSMVGGAPRDCEAWAEAIRAKILRQTGLSVSVGIAPTKLLAKMASEYRKPAGVTVVADKRAIEPFLRDRPAAAICGIGTRRGMHTDIEGWKTAWDIAQAPVERLSRLFGKPGREMQRELRGETVFAVSTAVEPPQSVSRCRSFRATRDPNELWAHLLRHMEYTVLKMRRWSLGCRGVSVWLRNDAYFHEAANLSLPQPMDTEEELQPYVERCFERVLRLDRSGRPAMSCTQVGIALWRLTAKHAIQFSLFDSPQTLLKGEALQRSLDTLHARYGRRSITRGAALQAKSGTEMKLDLAVYEA